MAHGYLGGVSKRDGNGTAFSQATWTGFAQGWDLWLRTAGTSCRLFTWDGLAVLLRSGGTAQDTCQALVEAALDRGGRDNVTVALARYRFPQGG